jgi:hypothetical protein
MAALSFNMQMLLVAFSTAPSEEIGGRPGEVQIDPSVLNPQDPFSRAPGRCSFAQPQYCASVSSFFSLATFLRRSDDDPTGSQPQWIWEAGANYQVVGANGDLADYEGGRVHVLGVEQSRTRAARTGVPIVLFPATGRTLAPETRFAAQAPSDASGASFGMAYLTAPEPADAALAIAALAALATLNRARRAAS